MASGADWPPTAPLPVLRRRAEWMECVRRFFRERSVTEVETPILAGAGVTDRHIEGLREAWTGRWLQSSPEYAMKRLLAAGMGDCYQITPAFRAAEQGRWHNPEFRLLEWYRIGYTADALMEEIERLIEIVLGAGRAVRRRYADVFLDAGLPDPLTATDTSLRAAAEARSGAPSANLSRRDHLDWLFSEVVAPCLPARCFVTHFPADQAVLARLHPDDPRVAERFELFIDGIEIANGFRELTDAAALRARFEADQLARREAGQPVVAVDERLLAALSAGMPDCAGVAVGLDRLFALAAGARSISGVIAFPWDRA